MPFTNETEEKQTERAVLVGLSCPSFNADQAADERTMDFAAEFSKLNIISRKDRNLYYVV